jgi:hypothetical protein
MAHFVAFFNKVSENCNLEITLWGKQGLVALDSKDYTIYW